MPSPRRIACARPVRGSAELRRSSTSIVTSSRLGGRKYGPAAVV
jgi:hypothetical protein